MSLSLYIIIFYIYFYVQMVGLIIEMYLSAGNVCFVSSDCVLFILLYEGHARGLPLESFTRRELINVP
jgi:hypothetical protein